MTYFILYWGVKISVVLIVLAVIYHYLELTAEKNAGIKLRDKFVDLSCRNSEQREITREQTEQANKLLAQLTKAQQETNELWRESHKRLDLGKHIEREAKGRVEYLKQKVKQLQNDLNHCRQKNKRLEKEDEGR